MGYGALSAANYFDSTGYTANPKVYGFKWGRLGWNGTATSYTNTNPVGASPITPGSYTISPSFLPTASICTGSTATSAGVPGLVQCVGFAAIQSSSSGMTNWTTTAADPSYRPVDIRTTVPAGQYIYNHTPAAYTFQIPFQSLFSSIGSYANLKKLDQTFTGVTVNKYVFYNRTQFTGLMAGMGGRMLGYDGLSISNGLKGWNKNYGEGNPGASYGTLLASQPVITTNLYAGQITSAYPAYTVPGTGLDRAPTISSVSSGTPSTTSATITWTTDYPATTQINDKTTYNDTVLNTSHSATINGLTPSTPYTVNAISYDCVANKAVSSVTFTTASACTPTGPEICDGLDNDCNGSIDDGLFRPTACGTGECSSAGTEQCVAGVWSNNTCTPGTPTAEICDGLDNDCNGTVDNGIASTPTTCGVGECASTGTLSCVGGSMVNSCVAGSPTTEICDGLDNDCNGAVDNGIASTPTSCGVGQCASTGTLSCVGGSMVNSCVAGSPTTEICDGLDNDCNGTTDEGCGCINGTTRSCGSDTGECVSGTETCVNGAWSGICVGEVGPQAEICDGLDNDCNGAVDNGIASTPTTCGVGECASTGTLSCVGGTMVDNCAAGSPTTEICDGLDNDCNGAVDNGIASTPTSCGTGECASTGTLSCVGGTMVDNCAAGQPGTEGPPGDATCSDGKDNDCDGTTDINDTGCTQICVPTTEVCDGVDNDCDGQIDEGIASTPTSCGTGECASTGTLSCVGGTMVDNCAAGSPTTEICDGKDNDCNGAVDNGIASTPTSCGTGECASTGTLSCVGGTMVDNCAAGQPGTEGPPGDATCSDGKDNDCDGKTDTVDSGCIAANLPDLSGRWTSLAVKQVTTPTGTQWMVYGNLRVTNRTANAGAFVIKYYFVPSAGRSHLVYIGQTSLVGLLKDAATNLSFRNLYTSNPSGTGSIRAVIDANNSVAESNEANNTNTRSIP